MEHTRKGKTNRSKRIRSNSSSICICILLDPYPFNRAADGFSKTFAIITSPHTASLKSTNPVTSLVSWSTRTFDSSPIFTTTRRGSVTTPSAGLSRMMW
ncbi:hypothetical protein ACKS0A_05604 [Histoplasma ohiense]